MIQLKATCLHCKGTGYVLQNENSHHHHNIPCPECKGKGVLILTSQIWDMSLERVPPFSPEEMEETECETSFSKFQPKEEK